MQKCYQLNHVDYLQNLDALLQEKQVKVKFQKIVGLIKRNSKIVLERFIVIKKKKKFGIKPKFGNQEADHDISLVLTKFKKLFTKLHPGKDLE